MPRYLVQRTFADLVSLPVDADGATICRNVIDGNADFGVTWLHTYVSSDKSVVYSVYDGPSSAAIRQAAEVNGLPLDQITEVSVLDPYFYH
jgi:hypothetical protein